MNERNIIKCLLFLKIFMNDVKNTFDLTIVEVNVERKSVNIAYFEITICKSERTK